jgi:hypothetical protein
MLVRLMYASRAAAGIDQEELAAIARQAGAANATQGITGVLCSTGEVFIQVLEGGRAPVNALYRRIVGDARHRDVTLLRYEEIGERRFANWSMGQVCLSRLNPALLLRYGETAELDPFTVSGAATAALFEELVATAAVMGPG